MMISYDLLVNYLLRASYLVAFYNYELILFLYRGTQIIKCTGSVSELLQHRLFTVYVQWLSDELIH